MFDATSHAVLRDISIHADGSELSAKPMGVTVDPDGKRANVACWRGEFIAVVDLAKGTACAHCASPLSMLDAGQAQRLVDALGSQARASSTVDPAMGLNVHRAKRDVQAAFASFEGRPGWFEDVAAHGVIDVSLSSLLSWLE